MSAANLVRLRVRYFSDGLVLGGREFVETVFAANRGRYSAKRKEGARSIAEVTGGGWFALRRLQHGVFG